MGKTKKCIIVTLAIIALGLLAWRISRPSEPEYQGKKLSTWLRQYDFYSPYINNLEKISIDAAINHIGTNAVPTLLRMLRKTDSPLERKFASLLESQTLIDFNYFPASVSHHQAEKAFSRLKDLPENVIPSLIEIYDQKFSVSSQCATANILALYRSKAKSAIPSLLQGATSPNTEIRISAIEALGLIHKDPFLIMPIFLENRDDPDTEVRDAATYRIWEVERNTFLSILTLFDSLNDPNETIRRQATNSLKEIYPEYSAQAGWK